MESKLDQDIAILGITPIEWQRIKRNPDRVRSHDTGTEDFSAFEYFKSKNFVLGEWLK